MTAAFSARVSLASGRKRDEIAEGARGGGLNDSAAPAHNSDRGEEVQIIFETRLSATRPTESRDSKSHAPRASVASNAELTNGLPVSPTEAGDGVVGGEAGVYETNGDARAGQVCGRSRELLEREGHVAGEEKRGDEVRDIWAEEDDYQRDGGLDKIDMMIMQEMRAQADALERVRAHGRRHVAAGGHIIVWSLCRVFVCGGAWTGASLLTRVYKNLLVSKFVYIRDHAHECACMSFAWHASP